MAKFDDYEYDEVWGCAVKKGYKSKVRGVTERERIKERDEIEKDKEIREKRGYMSNMLLLAILCYGVIYVLGIFGVMLLGIIFIIHMMIAAR